MTQNERVGAGVAIAAIALFWWQKSNAPIATVTTSEGFDLTPYGGPVVYPPAIQQLGQAIARAEGFFVAGSIPQLAHNPGDVKVPNWTGATLGNGIPVFDSDAAGWNALNHQLYLILVGQSSYYNLDMTIADMARTWTKTQADAWALNVATFLGVDPSAPIWSVLTPANSWSGAA